MEISPYVGGRSTAAGHANTIKLSSNESALGPSPKAQAAYRELAGTLHRYPDGGATELRTALGEKIADFHQRGAALLGARGAVLLGA